MGDERRINQLTTKAYSNIGSSDYFAVDNASEAESKKLPASSIKTPISNLQGEVTGGSDTYSSTKNYSVGMYVTHTTSGVQKLYRCKTACTAASWTTNASCFEEANLADAVSQLNNDLKYHERNNLSDGGDISSIGTNVFYTFSDDGYLYLESANNPLIVDIYGATVEQNYPLRLIALPINTAIGRQSIYIRKGMRCKIQTLPSTGAVVRYFRLQS